MFAVYFAIFSMQFSQHFFYILPHFPITLSFVMSNHSFFLSTYLNHHISMITCIHHESSYPVMTIPLRKHIPSQPFSSRDQSRKTSIPYSWDLPKLRLLSCLRILADCAELTSLQVLMGRDGAYKGVYSRKVLGDFKNIEETEKAQKYFCLDWKTGKARSV